jgi:hypothetical protein
MEFISILVLSVAINTRAPSSDTRDALAAVAKAGYIQTGLDKKVKVLEKKYVPEVVRENAGWMTLIIKITNEKKISYEWTF